MEQTMASKFATISRESIMRGNSGIIELPDSVCISALQPVQDPMTFAEWKDTAADYPENLCLHHLIEMQVARTPECIALKFEDESLTYAELNHRANLLAKHLRMLKVGPDVPVGLFVERSLEMVVGILGILKAGGAYLPIDVTTPSDRIAFLVADSGMQVVVTQMGLLPFVRCAASLALDTFNWNRKDDAVDQNSEVCANHLAYVIYTSGSTGKPKGVCVEHRSIVNYVLGVSERLHFKSGMNHAMVSTIAADLGNTVLFPALATGGCLHIISSRRAENPAEFAEYFSREQIDVLKIVPSHLAALQAGREPQRMMPRQRLILGGEASRLDWIDRLRGMTSTCEIYNHYGPTETTVGVLTYQVGAFLPETATGTLPLGRPLPNCRMYILDKNRKPLPPGVAGELYISGHCLARGYLNRKDLTRDRFIYDPKELDESTRLYRTGDRARYLANGDIEFLGRVDHQVKIRGYRVELGEVENALRSHPGVRDAVVTAVDDPAGTKRLVSYIIPRVAGQPLWSNKSAYLLPDGTSVAHLNKNETDYIYHEIFDLHAYLRHGVMLHDGDCIVDAGANIGLFTVFASRMAANLRIYACEPNPAVFACLEANAATWGDSVKCIPIGLSSKNTEADMTVFEGMSLLSGFHADAVIERKVVQTYTANQLQGSNSDDRFTTGLDQLLDDRFRARKQKAWLRTLSSLIAEEGIERIDLLKINVEKSELEILLGLRNEDWPKIRQMVIEVDEQKNKKPIMEMLQKRGFRVALEQDPLLRNTELCYIYALRPAVPGRETPRPELENHLGLPRVSDLARGLTPAGMRRHLKDRLPEYMVPSLFQLLPEFPLTANGKIDREKLPKPVFDAPASMQESHPPRMGIEAKLIRIWKEILQVENIDIHEDFFDLGGNSLLAIRAVLRIGEEFGKDLPLAVLLEAPTIVELARMLGREQEEPSWSSLVPLRTTGTRPPLFLMHSHGGNTLEYRTLASLLDFEQPVYTLQARGLDGHIIADTSLEEMAAAYIREIRTVQPKGPYYLGGYCLGGLLALEAAQQLTGEGEKVALLVFIQAMNPSTMQFRPELPFWRRWWYLFTNQLSLEREYLAYRQFSFLAERVRFHWQRAQARAAIATGRIKSNGSTDLSQTPMHFILEVLGNIHQEAMQRYIPQSYGGDVLIFRAGCQPCGWIAGADLGWDGVLTGKVEFYEIPGHRQNLLHQPNVAQLARQMNECLVTVQRSSAGDARQPNAPQHQQDALAS